MNDVQQRYDEVPYASNAYADTHPDRLATIATLFGMRPAPPTSCRLLEIGCASGGNLVPMAASLPGSCFVGADLSPVQVAHGQPLIAALGLENLELVALDLTEIGPEHGQFDYIVAHGVYSWVPPHVQRALLRVVRERLTPHGVAMISFNALPGWRLHGVVRDLMLFHVADIQDPVARIVASREVLSAYAESLPDTPWGRLFRDEHKLLSGLPDSYLFHDFLSPLNEPLWFHEFVDRAGSERLTFLADADLPRMFSDGIPDEAAEVIQQLAGDVVESGQYLDYARNRGFRSALLVRDDAPLDRGMTWERAVGLYATGLVLPVGDVDLADGVELDFRSYHGVVFSADTPLLKAALLVLSEERPRGTDLGTLRRLARERLGHDPDATAADDEAVLARNLLFCYARGLVDLNVRRVDCAIEPGERPRAWAVSRLLAERGDASVTNLRHETVHIGVFERMLLAALDGVNDRFDLVRLLVDAARRGEIVLRDAADDVITDSLVIADAMAQHLEVRLDELARLALLEA